MLINIRHIAILLFLAGSFYACAEKTEAECKGGEVPYKPCEFDSGGKIENPFDETGKLRLKEVYLFRGLSTQMYEKVLYEMSKGLVVGYIVFNSETGSSNIHIIVPCNVNWTVFGIGTICNFPDFAKKWNIPQNGIKVDIEGILYYACWGGPCDIVNFGDGRVRFNLMLTNLKRK